MSDKMNTDGHESKDRPDGDPFDVKGLSNARYAKSLDGAVGAAQVGKKPPSPQESKGD